MKIPGYIKVQLLLLSILTISSVSSTGLQIFKMEKPISDESIFIKRESLREAREELQASQIGKSITDHVQN
mgnify:CR=1 FL=1